MIVRYTTQDMEFFMAVRQFCDFYGYGGEPSGEMAEAGTNPRDSQHTRETRHCRCEA